MEQTSLESVIKSFRESCEVCKDELYVHAFRPKTNGKRKVVYAHCLNKECRMWQRELAFYGS